MFDSDIQRLIYCLPACCDRRNVAKMRGALSSFVAIKKLFTVGAIGKYFSVPTLRRQESIKKRSAAWKDWHVCQVLLVVSYSLWQRPGWKIGKRKKLINFSPGPWGQHGRWQILRKPKTCNKICKRGCIQLAPQKQLITNFAVWTLRLS